MFINISFFVITLFYFLDVVQCVNSGFDGSDVQWKCMADMPETYRFGELDVYCEGKPSVQANSRLEQIENGVI